MSGVGRDAHAAGNRRSDRREREIFRLIEAGAIHFIETDRLLVTDAAGNVRYAMTNAFGYYRFDEIPVGATYVVSVRHKRYQFAPQIVTVQEELTELDFTAQE